MSKEFSSSDGKQPEGRLALPCSRYHLSVQDFVIRLCLAAVFYYIVWMLICYCHSACRSVNRSNGDMPERPSEGMFVGWLPMPYGDPLDPGDQ